MAKLENLLYRNARLLVLLICLIVVAGLSSFYVLPRMEDPVLTERFAILNTVYPGGTPQRVEALVTEKLEEELTEVEEIKEIRSVSRAGVATIVLELHDWVDQPKSEEVWSRVRDKMDDARAEFPPGVREPEIDVITTKAYALIVGLKWTLDGEPSFAILRRQAEKLEDLLRAIPGTEKADSFGDPEEEVIVEIDAAKLAHLGLGAADVAGQLRASDAKIAAGVLRGPRGDLLLEVDGELDSIARVGRTPIHYGDGGRFVRLSDMANIDKGIARPPSSLAIIDGVPGIAVGATVEETRRVDHWSDQAKAEVAAFAEQLPRGVEATLVFDQNTYVADRLGTLMTNLLIGALAVMAVICLLMGWRNALVVGAALPLAALMVLTGLNFLDIPIHQMSVTGLIIALGLLIDNAIVMVDEVRQRLDEGASPAAAVGYSVRHLAVPLFGSTLTTALAFGPIALMPGAAGEFVGSIAVSVILAVFSSLLLALTVTPTLAALMSRLGGGSHGEGRRHWWQTGFRNRRLTEGYRRTLDFIFRRPAIGIGLGLILPTIGFVQARTLPEQFFPPTDRNQFHIQMELPATASMPNTLDTVVGMRRRLLAHDEVVGVNWFLGESAPTFYYNLTANRKNTSSYAQAIVQLKSAEGARELIRRLQAELDAAYPQARTLVRQLEQGPPFDAPIEVRLFGPDLETLRRLGNEARALLAATKNVTHTKADLNEALPKLAVKVDEEQARLAGLDHASIARQVDSTTQGAVGGSVLEETEELPVRVRLSNKDRARLDRIASLDLLAAGQDPHQRTFAPLSAVADFALVPEPSSIPRLDNRRMNEVQGFVQAGVLPSTALAEVRARLAESDVELPPGYSLEYGGEASKRDQAVGNLSSSVAILMVVMAATLVLSFGSFRIAALIGSVAALAVGLGLGALWQFGLPMGFMAIVGTMGLVGVAINDAIVVLAALGDNPEARIGDPAAVRDVVVRATRHVFGTTLTTIAGFMPLVLGGGGFWPPLAIAIAGGVSGATILALYFIPSAYILVMCRGCREKSAEQESESVVAGSPTPERMLVGA